MCDSSSGRIICSEMRKQYKIILELLQACFSVHPNNIGHFFEITEGYYKQDYMWTILEDWFIKPSLQAFLEDKQKMTKDGINSIYLKYGIS